MNKYFVVMLLTATLCLAACGKQKNKFHLHFSTSAQFPPFEYNNQGVIKGFDIDLAKLIAKELGMKAVFDDMQFSTVLPAVSSGQDEAAIATITITEERKKNFDFSESLLFRRNGCCFINLNEPVLKPDQLQGKKVGAQLGTVMEIWLRQNYPQSEITTLDDNNLAIQTLISGHLDVVLLDGTQGKIYSKKRRDCLLL